jgi:dienelactone hydrolase
MARAAIDRADGYADWMPRRRLGAGLAATGLIACALAGFLGVVPGCLTPPALLPAEWVDGERCIALYPQGTQRVEIPVERDTTLRGLFVPAGEGAPVVLHLLESSGSAATLKYHYYALCDQLADLGYASLLMDYSGVGASSGSASPRHLARDAEAMWDEALRRAGGDPERVVVRGISIGTLAAAHLLSDGARPLAAILIAPIRAETAVTRFAAQSYNGLVGWLAGGLYRDVTDVDLARTLAQAQVPLLVVTGSLDFFLSDEERDLLYDAVVAAKGTWVQHYLGHVALTIAGHEVMREELSFLPGASASAPILEARVEQVLAALDPDAAAHFADAAARARLKELVSCKGASDPSTTAALALAGAEGSDAILQAWRLRVRPYAKLPFDTLAAAVSLRGPLGPLPTEWLDRCGMPLHVLTLYGSSFASLSDAQRIAKTVQSAMRGEDVRESVSLELGFDSAEVVVDPTALVQSLRASGGSEEAVRATAALVLLKAQRIPARAVETPRGPGVETWSAGAWLPLDLDPPAADPSSPIVFSGFGKLPQELGERATALVAEAGTPPAEQ